MHPLCCTPACCRMWVPRREKQPPSCSRQARRRTVRGTTACTSSGGLGLTAQVGLGWRYMQLRLVTSALTYSGNARGAFRAGCTQLSTVARLCFRRGTTHRPCPAPCPSALPAHSEQYPLVQQRLAAVAGKAAPAGEAAQSLRGLVQQVESDSKVGRAGCTAQCCSVCGAELRPAACASSWICMPPGFITPNTMPNVPTSCIPRPAASAGRG